MLEKEQISRFAELLEHATGLSISCDDLRKFAPLLADIAAEHSAADLDAFLNYLESCPGTSDDWTEIAEALTIGESYFFRDHGQIALLKNVILPQLVESKQNARELRIVSAGCSTGEECYTLSILLDQILGSSATSWNIDIVGLDIHRQSLKRAKQGVYRKWSFRGQPSGFQKSYFTEQGDSWRINDQIRTVVRFLEHNLASDALPDPSRNLVDIDLIICRNVFIYFSPQAIQAVMRKFTCALREGAYLLTGHVELGGQDLSGLETLQMPDSLVYRKCSQLAEPSQKKCPTILTSKSKLTGKASFETQRSKPKPAAPKITCAAPQKPLVRAEQQSELTEELQVLFQRGEYEQVMERIGGSTDMSLLKQQDFCLLIEACVNSGRVEQACNYCTQFIELDELNPLPQYLLAHLVQEAGDMTEAKKLLQKVIYLDPEAVGAYLSLGTIYDTEGLMEKASKQRENALQILQGWEKERKVPYFDEVTAAELMKYVQTLFERES